MRTLAIVLLIAGPILLLFGMAGCAAALGSIGVSSREMTFPEAAALLAAFPCFVLGLVLLLVHTIKHRRGRKEGQHAHDVSEKE